VLPVTALVIGGFATLTILTKNSFLNEITRQYVVTARAKGLSERRCCTACSAMRCCWWCRGFPRHSSACFCRLAADRGDLLPRRPGRMSYEAALSRDYPVVFGSLFIFTLFGLLIKLIGDLFTGRPRIDFAARNA
jgi:microcin C transport system permease protein